MDPSLTGKVTQEAWIGDAVLALYARSLILKEDNGVDGPKSVRMTSNRFLNALGDPTRVEAEIGRIYQQHGLATAFEWIEATIVPLFRKQEDNRQRKTIRRTLR